MTKVKCMICGEEFDWLPRHITVHNINTKEYKKKFPDAEIMSEKVRLSRTDSNNPMYGAVPWNKGLTKDTDSRVKKYSVSKKGKRKDLVEKQLGKTFEEIWGEEKGREIANKISKAKKEKYAFGETVSQSKGKTKKNDEGCRKRSKALTGKPKSEEHKKNLSKSRRILFKDPIFVQKMIKVWNIKPNKPEKLIYSLLNHILPKEYVINVKGNKLIIGRKIPDFVNINGKKKLIEFNGCWNHSCPICFPDGGRNGRIEGLKETEKRVALFKSLGWDTLVIWEHEMKDINIVVNKILAFHDLPSLHCSRQMTLTECEVGGGKSSSI